MISRIFKLSVTSPDYNTFSLIPSLCSRRPLRIEQFSFGFIHSTSNGRYDLVQLELATFRPSHATRVGIASPLPNRRRGLLEKDNSNDGREEISKLAK
jgi:hypothetical protein